jgi:hypothetical protein
MRSALNISLDINGLVFIAEEGLVSVLCELNFIYGAFHSVLSAMILGKDHCSSEEYQFTHVDACVAKA